MRKEYHDSQKGVTAGGGLDKKRSVSEKQYDKERAEHEEEEKEAMKLQRQRSSRLNEQDYGVETKSKKSKKPQQEESLEKTSSEKLKIIMRDAPELVELVADLKSKLSTIREQLHPLVTKVQSKQYATEQGISYLEVKLHLLLSYCTNIMFYLLLKSSGKSVKDHPVITQLVEMRLLLEKIRPIDERMKYQIDKLVSLANRNDVPTGTGHMDHKPRPDMLADDDDEDEDMEQGDSEEEEQDEEDDGDEQVNSYYVPAKLMPVAYDEKTNSRADKERKRLEEKVSRAPILQTVKNMLGDAPEELPQIGTDADLRPNRNKMAKEVEDYEMENFTRVQLNKKDAKKLKRDQESIVDPLRELDSFADLQALDKFIKSKKNTKDKLLTMQYTGDADEALAAIEQANDSEDDQEEEEEQDEASKSEEFMRNSGLLYGGDDDDDEEEEPSNKRRKTDKPKDRRKERDEQDAMFDYDERDENGKRKATPKILKNRGLAPSRKKENSNPRVKLRGKFAKATSGQKFVKQLPRGGSYGGQKSISTGVVKSRKI